MSELWKLEIFSGIKRAASVDLVARFTSGSSYDDRGFGTPLFGRLYKNGPDVSILHR